MTTDHADGNDDELVPVSRGVLRRWQFLIASDGTSEALTAVTGAIRAVLAANAPGLGRRPYRGPGDVVEVLRRLTEVARLGGDLTVAAWLDGAARQIEIGVQPAGRDSDTAGETGR